MAGTKAMTLWHRIGRDLLRREQGGWIALVNEWRRRAGSRRELAALCDRALRDIGVTRYDVEREASKPFWRA